MGKLEQTAKRKRRRVMVEQTILAALSVAGVIGLMAVAPNATRLLKYIDFGFVGKRDPRRRVSEAMSRLRRKGLVAWTQEKGKWHLRLTEKGKRHARRIRLRELTIPRPRRWDGRWRFVMFDIPERRKALREQVRNLLIRLGFHHFQHSVWVYPFDCEEVIALLKLELGTGNQLLYIVADAVEYDTPLRKHFGLPAA